METGVILNIRSAGHPYYCGYHSPKSSVDSTRATLIVTPPPLCWASSTWDPANIVKVASAILPRFNFETTKKQRGPHMESSFISEMKEAPFWKVVSKGGGCKRLPRWFVALFCPRPIIYFRRGGAGSKCVSGKFVHFLAPFGNVKKQTSKGSF